MGSKYAVSAMLSGHCPHTVNRRSNNIFVALWWLVKLSIKYPIVDFEIRRGYVSCEECQAAYCWKKEAGG